MNRAPARSPRALLAICALSLLGVVVACAPPAVPPDAGPGDEPAAACTEPTEVACEDQSIQQLQLFDVVNPGSIDEEESEPFVHRVDATAGGFNNLNTSYNYARFTDEGLQKVEISDEEAFTSMDWDIGFRRFVIRLNSGVSGPSCVTGARAGADATFDDVTEVSDGLTFRAEEYFDAEADCQYIADGSGLGSPGVVLQNYWTYPGCVQMTGNVYVLRLASGRHVKLEVLSYYRPDAQEACDVDGSLPAGDPGSANFRVRWAFLD